MAINRRDFIRGAAGASGALAAGSVLGKNLLANETEGLPLLPQPNDSGIEHIVSGDNGEPQLRPHAGMVARSARTPGRVELQR